MTIIGAGVLVLAVGAFLYAVEMIKCVKDALLEFSQSKSDTNHKRILKLLADFIEFHTREKELSNFFVGQYKENKTFQFQMVDFRLFSDFSDIYQNILAILFIWSMITMCGAMLMIQIGIVECKHFFDFSTL